MAEINQKILKTLLLSVENQFRAHYTLVQSALEIQRRNIKEMYVLAQRFAILIHGAPSEKLIPPEASHEVDEEVKADFHIKLRDIEHSNKRLNNSIEKLKDEMYALTRYVEKTNVVSLDKDCSIRSSITYYMQIFSDFLKYFVRIQSKLNTHLELITSDDVTFIKRYKKLLNPNQEFNDNFFQSLAQCNWE